MDTSERIVFEMYKRSPGYEDLQSLLATGLTVGEKSAVEGMARAVASSGASELLVVHFLASLALEEHRAGRVPLDRVFCVVRAVDDFIDMILQG